MKEFGNPIPTGNVVATNSGLLKCKKVIHAVCPIYSKNYFDCPLIFKRTVGNSIGLAKLMKMESIAFPALCTGLYRFPTSIVTRLLFDEILHYNHHKNVNGQIKEFVLIDISEARAKMLVREFD